METNLVDRLLNVPTESQQTREARARLVRVLRGSGRAARAAEDVVQAMAEWMEAREADYTRMLLREVRR